MRCAILLFGVAILQAQNGGIDAVRGAFANPPDDARIMMRWWWFGSAVTKPELAREMELMKQGGIGGFEVQPVYPLALDDPRTGFRNLAYLSNEYLDALRFTAERAHELGLRMDVTLGSGWPFGGPHTPVTEAAGRLRCDRVEVPAHASSLPLPDISTGEKLLAVFLDGERRLTDIAGGRLRLPAGLEGTHVVQFFIASRTGQQVKRAAVGAEGFVLDHYSRAAIDHHLALVGDRLMSALRANPPYAVFSDSLEVYGSDWTDDLLAEFQKRRGYDLTPYLPALAGEIGEKTADIRHDWGLTLTELCEEHYLRPITEWAHKNGTRFRSQTYGIPPVALSSNALVDLPEGEQQQVPWRQFSTTRWASSASHLYSRPVTSSETWTWLHSPAFRATPLDMKAEADLHFIEGINQLVGHGWPYSPESAGEPGWRFYAAAVFNQHNPWWIVMPDITKYLQRVSYLLRQGQPANDVAVYLPTHDAYAEFAIGRRASVNDKMEALLGPALIPQILDAGYNLDFVDDAAIGRMHQRVLVLPEVKRMPAATKQGIAEFERRGGVVIKAGDVASELPRKVIPDFVTGEAAIGFIHRKLDDGDIYFIANTSNEPVRATARVRAKGSAAEWWDPFNGTTQAVRMENGSVRLDLEPYESRVLVISNGKPGTVRLEPEWSRMEIAFPAGEKRDPYFSGLMTYEKTVTVPPASAVALDFGRGTPTTGDAKTMGYRALLDSPVREAAVVYVNGKKAGSVWHPPYRIDITQFVHEGDNELKVVVGNTAINELAGQRLPDYRLLNLRYGERFTPQDMKNLEPLPSGLVGRVALLYQASHHHVPQNAAEYARVLNDPARDAWQKPHDVVMALNLKPTDAIADIGAGTGYFSIRFAHHAAKVFAVDIDKGLLDMTAKNGPPNLQTVLATPDDPKLPPASVDVIFFCDVLHHIQNRAPYYQKLKATLKPGGRIVNIDFYKKDLPVGPPASMKLSEDQVIGELKAAGFRLARKHDFLPYQYFMEFALNSK